MHDITLHSLEGSITWNTEIPFKPGLQIPPQTVDPNTHSLHVPITDAQIYAIEERRTGDFVPLRIALRGLATIPNKRVPVAGYVLQQGETTVQPIPRLETQIVQEQTNNGEMVFIQLQDWLRILNELEFSKHRLIELPQPTLPPDDDAHWKDCVRLVEEATQFHRSGKYEPVQGNCRKIIEGTVATSGAHFGIKRDPKMRFPEMCQKVFPELEKVWPSDRLDLRLFMDLSKTAFTWSSHAQHFNANSLQRDQASLNLALATDLLVLGAQILEATAAITPTPKGSSAVTTTEGSES